MRRGVGRGVSEEGEGGVRVGEEGGGGAFAPPQKTSFGPVPCLTGCVRRQASALYTYICTSTLCRQVRGLEFWGL